MKKIGVQLRGSGQMKTLPEDVVKEMIKRLTTKYQVVILDQDKDKGFEGHNIINTCGKLNVYECIALLMRLDCCITMDSGMLWLAHAANCPVLTILGPTREEERVSLHPQYPQKAKSLSISKEINGCEPCFETKAHCKGAINCMKKFDHEIFYTKLQQKLIQIVGE
jgi:ADP-heptose:LPS heptosyltransferase